MKTIKKAAGATKEFISTHKTGLAFAAGVATTVVFAKAFNSLDVAGENFDGDAELKLVA